MEEIIDTMTGVSTDNCTAICTRNRLSLNIKENKGIKPKPESMIS